MGYNNNQQYNNQGNQNMYEGESGNKLIIL